MATVADQTVSVPDGALVVGNAGLWGTARRLAAADPAAASTVDLVLSDGRHVRLPARMLHAERDGHYSVALAPADLPAPTPVVPAAMPAAMPAAPVLSPARPDAATSPHAAASASATDAASAVTSTAADGQVVPLLAEQLDVRMRRVETGRVRVTKRVETHEEQVDLPTVRDTVTVERVPIEQFVHAVPAVRHEGDVTIIPVIEEVLVVEKRLMLLEEVRLTVRRTVTHDSQTVTLRKETAHVERLPPADPPTAGSVAAPASPDR